MIPGIVGQGSAGGGAPTPPPAAYHDVIIADSPIRYLRLEETSGTAIADAMGGTDWVIAGTYTLDIDGAVDRAIKVTSAGINRGTDTVPQSASSGFSIEFWVKLFSADSSANGYIIGRANTFDVIFHFGGANTITVFRNVAPTLASTVLPVAVPRDDAWHHYVVTHNGSIIRGYLDGSEATTHSQTATFALSSDVRVGRTTINSVPFVGGLDEVAFYGYVLTPTQVADHYAAR